MVYGQFENSSRQILRSDLIYFLMNVFNIMFSCLRISYLDTYENKNSGNNGMLCTYSYMQKCASIS